MNRNQRERFAEFFQYLVQPGAESDSHRDADSDAALRVLSHALLNYWDVRERADATGVAEMTADLSHALPWLAGFLSAIRSEGDDAPIARQLLETSGEKTLSEAMIARRLDAFDGRTGGALGKSPRLSADSGDAQLDMFCALANTERRLALLSDLDPQTLRDRLLEDTFLLAAAAERCEDEEVGRDSEAAAPTSLLNHLLGAVEPWRMPTQPAGNASGSQAIWVLAGLHDTDGVSTSMAASMGARTPELAPKSLRFERGLAENMARMGFISAVRAALAFALAPAVGPDMPAARSERLADKRVSFLREFSVFRADESLLHLASALMQTRGLCLDYLRGGAPLASLSPWIEYLRGECAELAEARECTLREAMSYAHYCLHLVNICDFTAIDSATLVQSSQDAPLSEVTREALCQIEDELKEFALLGQREGLSDAQADLGRFERARWRREGDAPFLADRLTRLRGAWRRGVRPGPIGAPPRLDADVSAHSLAIIDNLLVEAGESELSGLAEIISNAYFHGCQWLEFLTPPNILKLLAICATAARDLPGVDITRSFDVDLGALGLWATDPETGRLNRRILGMLLERRQMPEILNGDAAGQERQMALRRGLVAHTRSVAGEISASEISAHRGAPDPQMGAAHLVVQFIADPELKALLELMSTSSAQDPAFHDLLAQRLEAMLHRHEAGAAPETMIDDTPQDRPGGENVANPATPGSTQQTTSFSSSQPAPS